MTHALSTPCFEAARSVLTGLDTNVFSPLCRVEILAIPPRIVQIATNVLGLAGSAASGAVLSGLCLLPLPEQQKDRAVVWKQDAWTLVQQLVDKIGRLCIALIPFAGTKILDQNDSLQTQCGDLVRLRADLDLNKAELAQAQANFAAEHAKVRLLEVQQAKKDVEFEQKAGKFLDRIVNVGQALQELQEKTAEAEEKAKAEKEVDEVVKKLLHRDLEFAKARLMEFDQQNETLKSEVSRLQKEGEEAREQIADEQSKTQRLEARLGTANQEIVDLQLCRIHLQEQVAGLTTELEQARADLEEATQQSQSALDAV